MNSGIVIDIKEATTDHVKLKTVDENWPIRRWQKWPSDQFKSGIFNKELFQLKWNFSLPGKPCITNLSSKQFVSSIRVFRLWNSVLRNSIFIIQNLFDKNCLSLTFIGWNLKQKMYANTHYINCMVLWFLLVIVNVKNDAQNSLQL